MLVVLISISTIACRSNGDNQKTTFQKDILRIEQFKDELPNNYFIMDIKERALKYDEMVFDFNISGTFFPLIWQDETFNSFGIAAYAGDYRHGIDGSQEAVTSIAAVLSATLLGIDKSNQNGFNFVDALNVFFNEEEQVVINNPSGNSRNISMWYMLYPAILFTQVSLEYENETTLRENALKTIESWYQAHEVMHELGSYDYTGFNFVTMEPYRNDIWREPDSAVGISLLMYYGYQLTQDDKYKEAAIQALEYIDTKYFGSPMYEILLYYAPYLAAKYNLEFGTNFNTVRMFDSIFNGSSIPRGGWGMLNDTYNEFEVSGLMGSITDGGGYAFSMNTFTAAYIIAKTVKYDTRYASSIGKWLNHLISNSRYFFADYAKDENETMYISEFAEETQAFNEIADNTFPYEGIRKSGSSKTPWFGGDPTVYNWAKTDFSLYSGASMGMLASLYEKTNVEGILKIDLSVGDYFNDLYPTYLLYNPHNTKKTVSYDPQGLGVDIYDLVTDNIIHSNVTTSVDIEIEAHESVVIMEVDHTANLIKTNKEVKLQDKVINGYHATLNILSHQNNDEVPKKFNLIVSTAMNAVDEVDYYEVVINGITTKYTTNTLKIETTSGSKTLTIKVYTKGGLYDQVTLRVRVK